MPEYQQRVHDERTELATRLSALNEFILSDFINKVQQDEQNRLRKQYGIMLELYNVLTERINNF